MFIRYFPWFGGKYRIINEISSMLPENIDTFMEVFAGSAAVTLNKARCRVEVINDLNPHIARLHRLMADKNLGMRLVNDLLSVKPDYELYKTAEKSYKNNFIGLNDEIEKAKLTYVLITQSFNATLKSFRKNIDESSYMHLNWANLPLVHKRLQGVQIRNTSAIDIFKEYKNDATVCIFADPPYRQELRGAKNVYTYEMPMEIQIEMLETIKDAQCKIMLCGYRSIEEDDLYDKFLLPYGWKHYKLASLPKSCQGKKEKDYGEEWVWLNYSPNVNKAKYFVDLGTSCTEEACI